jgi:uncharacterized protein YjbI with pentapeptide repeats
MTQQNGIEAPHSGTVADLAPGEIKDPEFIEGGAFRSFEGNSSVLQSPASSDRRAWKAYWKEQGQAWRTEPEIDAERQEFLARRLLIVPDIKEGLYPFKDVKLARADVEWLLGRFYNEDGPGRCENKSRQRCERLDLRGADLCGADLGNLPLAGLRGGLSWNEWSSADSWQREMAAAYMMGTNLREAQLVGADLLGTHLEGACLLRAHLEEATLVGAHLKRARLSGAHLEQAYLLNAHLESAHLLMAHLQKSNLMGAHLERARFAQAHLEKATLTGAYLHGANFREAYLQGADLRNAHLGEAYLMGTHLEGANLREAYLAGAYLLKAYLEGADLLKAHLAGARMQEVHLEGASLREAYLAGANLSGAYLAGACLEHICFSDEKGRGPQLVDVHLGDVQLAAVTWQQVRILGDEYQARQNMQNDNVKDKATRLSGYRSAVRANRQLAHALQFQGLHEEAARYAYRAQKLQRTVLRLQGRPGAYIFSWLLELLTGYGYRPVRLLFWYLLLIFGFAAMYVTSFSPHLSYPDALIFSITVFHGRGLFPTTNTYGLLVAILSITEAVVGLLIEMSFLAILVRCFMNV